ncbi:MAG: DUF1080 domain-containing protein [Lentisphaeria bacterium]|nr:DUF1080 domain-containing protein [Lentisphaeria bacterium]
MRTAMTILTPLRRAFSPCGAAVILGLLAAGCRSSREGGGAGPIRPGVADGWTGAARHARRAPLAMDRRVPPWTLAVQAYSFRQFSLLDAAARMADLGVAAVEMYPGQTLGGDLQGKVHHGMPADTREALLKALRQRGVLPVAYGVVNGSDEAEWTSIFEFAKAMGIGVVCCEPKREHLDIVAALCDRYEIRAAIHNHARPSAYWDPRTVLEAVQNRTPRLGACPDNGHWARSGLDGIEGLRLLGTRVHDIHLKDVDSPTLMGECVPLGAGFCDVARIVGELLGQGYSGLVTLEYESEPKDPVPGIRDCIAFLRECAARSDWELRLGLVAAASMSWEIADTWRNVVPGPEGRWQEPETKDDDTTGYTDTTDDAKGTVSAIGEGFPNEHYPNAFDNDTKTKWCIKKEAVWIEYRYPEDRREHIAAYSIATANDAPARDPRDWKLLGSNDGGKTWATVDERRDEKWGNRHQRRLFQAPNPGAYNLYRLDITKNHGADTCQLSEIELLAPPRVDPLLTPAEAEALFATADGNEGFRPLFARDLADAILDAGAWVWEDGELVARGGGDIWTRDTFGDFVLDLEFQCAPDSNSGVFLRCRSIEEWLHTAIEVQILQPDAPDKRHLCGAIFDCLAPVTNAVRQPGEWNRFTILARANRILVRLNGVFVLDMNLDRWTEAGRNPDGTPNKFQYAYRDMARTGHLGLQYHGQPIRFRNLRLRPLP